MMSLAQQRNPTVNGLEQTNWKIMFHIDLAFHKSEALTFVLMNAAVTVK